MLQLPNGTWTNTLDETYAHLLEVHFTGCTRISDNILQQVPKRAPFFNCNEVRHIVTEDRIKWPFSTMALTKLRDKMESTRLYYKRMGIPSVPNM